MCYVVVVDRGEKELETPKEVKEHFGIELSPYWCYNEVYEDACLCQLDLEKMFDENNIPYKYEPSSMWYHVGGNLDELVFD